MANLKNKTPLTTQETSIRQFHYLSLLAFTLPIKASSNAALLDNIITA
jgi:hypothetical protein